MSTLTSPTPNRVPGRLFLLLGLLLAPVGVIAYLVQVWMLHLTAPWYMPILGTLAAVLIVASLWQKRTVWRFLALVPVLLLATGEWMFVLGTRLPAYTGPVAVGQPFPAFATVRADGTPFTQRDLEGDQNNVFVFFRGRW
jgi:hypothetical protein